MQNDSWKILIVDDDHDVHAVTKLVLRGLKHDGKGLEFISAYSSDEAKKRIIEHPDTAIILLDLVLEELDSGIIFVKYLRETAGNKKVRVILLTGKPNVAPAAKMMMDYDISDYREKTELTREKFRSSVVSALESLKEKQ